MVKLFVRVVCRWVIKSFYKVEWFLVFIFRFLIEYYVGYVMKFWVRF